MKTIPVPRRSHSWLEAAPRVALLGAVLMGLAALGCSGDKQTEMPKGDWTAGDEGPSRAALVAGKQPDSLPRAEFAGGGGRGAAETQGSAPPTSERKIIYDATVEVAVKDLDEGQKLVDSLIQKHRGIVAQSEISGAAGRQRTGYWKVRIPVGSFTEFLQAVSKIGELQRTKQDSKEVTEEFYDLEARIKNKKLEEARLLKHLETSTGKLEEILAVEKEISRVRDEIERQQGRLNLLANLTSLTTVEITLRELKDYVPITAPTFGSRVSRAFEKSWEAFLSFGEGLVVFAVALAPWLPLLAVAIVVLYYLLKRLKVARNERAAVRYRPAPADVKLDVKE